MPKVSICMAIWNTSHLIGRTLHSLTQQSYDDFEVILVDDCSEDDTEAAIAPYRDKLDIKLHHLVHDFGMRGNSQSFNAAFGLAQGEILAENTPEIIWYPDCLKDLVSALERLGPKAWVSVRTYNLTPEDQLLIDTVDWKSDVRLLETLPNFDNPWTKNNRDDYFGTHQTCVIYRDAWFQHIRRFPAYLDYGSDDPYYSGKRQRHDIVSATIVPYVYHTWHAPIAFWTAHGKAPNWNKWGHTMKNHFNDPLIPDGGTSMLWDTGPDRPEGPHFQMSDEEAKNWRDQWTETVVKTGFKRKDGKPL